MERIEEKWNKIQELLKDMDPAEADKRVGEALFRVSMGQIVKAWLDDLFVDDYDKMQSRIDIVNKLMFDKDPKTDTGRGNE